MSDSQPPDDVSATRPREAFMHRPISKQWLALGTFVIVHIVLGGVCGFFIEKTEPPLEYLLVGIVFSQPVLIAIWIALAPHRFHIRFLWGLLLFTLTFFAVGCGISLNNPAFVVRFSVVDLMVLIAASLILSLVWRLTHWQIIHCDGKQSVPDYHLYQFGIKHLIILTTIVALALGLFRTLLLISPRSSLPGIFEVAEPLCESTVVLFPVIIIPWFTLAYMKNTVSSLIRAVILMGIVDVAAFCIFKWITRSSDIVQIFLFVQLGASLSMFVTALVIRLCGFRMARVRASSVHIDA
jgi:hypothetical protein